MITNFLDVSVMLLVLVMLTACEIPTIHLITHMESFSVEPTLQPLIPETGNECFLSILPVTLKFFDYRSLLCSIFSSFALFLFSFCLNVNDSTAANYLISSSNGGIYSETA